MLQLEPAGSINVIMNNSETKPKEKKNKQKDLLGDEKVAELHVTKDFDSEIDLIITLVYTKTTNKSAYFHEKREFLFVRYCLSLRRCTNLTRAVEERKHCKLLNFFVRHYLGLKWCTNTIRAVEERKHCQLMKFSTAAQFGSGHSWSL